MSLVVSGDAVSTWVPGGLVGGDVLGRAESGNCVRDFARCDFEDEDASSGVVKSRRMRPGCALDELELPPSSQNERCLPSTFFMDLNTCFFPLLPLEISIPGDLTAVSLAAVSIASPGLWELSCPRDAGNSAS